MGENYLSKSYAPMWEGPLNYRFFTVKEIFGGPGLNNNKDKKRKKSIENGVEGVKVKYQNSFNDLLKQKKENENKKIFEIYMGKSSRQWEKEKDLYKKITGKDLDIVYPNNKDDWRKVIKFWTNLFFYILPKNKEENKNKENFNEEQMLLLIMSSKEFAEILTSSDNQYSSFYRSVFLQNDKKLSETVLVEKLNNNERLVGKIQTDFIRALEQVFTNQSEVIIETLGEHGIIKKGVGYSHNQIKKLLEDKNDINFKRELKKLFENITREIMKKTQNNISELRISKEGEENKPYLILNLSDENFLNKGTYQKLLEKNKIFYNKDGSINYNVIFLNASINAIKKMNRLEQINLGFMEQEITGEAWKNFLKKNKWRKILSEKVKKLNIGKVNLNSGLRGILGEFLRVNFKPDFVIESQQTGKVYDRVKIDGEDISLGESFSDTFYKIGEENNLQKIGLNIKHYVSKMGNDTITIYNKQKGITFMHSYIYRYFDKDIVSLLRFVDVNYKLIGKLLLNISEKELNDQYKNLAQINLTNFVRATTAADVDYSNYFFVINNQYIPTSYIYYLISQKLNDSSTQFFNIELNSSFRNYSENEANNNVKNIIKQSLITSQNIKSSTKIIFNGLDINMLY